MSANLDQPTALDVPLTVKVVAGQVIVNGALSVAVSLTKDAALATGIELINAALGIDPDDEKYRRR